MDGLFGEVEETKWDTTKRMNEKGGMNEYKFERYVEDNLMRLYPDTADIPGKRVMIKADSGPGCM